MKGREIMSELSALVGIDFSLLKTKLYAAYEKNGKEGYSVLLMPREQESDNSVTLDEIMQQINKISGRKTTSKEEDSMKAGIMESLGSLEKKDSSLEKENSSLEKEDSSIKTKDSSLETKDSSIENMEFKLCMAYLYWNKKEKEDATLEYAFKLQILTENVVPTEIQAIVNVDRIMISVWKTDRPKVINEMALISIKDFLEG